MIDLLSIDIIILSERRKLKTYLNYLGIIASVLLTLIIEKYLNEGILMPEPDLKEKIQMLKKHLNFEISFRGEEAGMKFFRKFYPCYIKGIRGSAEYRRLLITELNRGRIEEILNEILKHA